MKLFTFMKISRKLIQYASNISKIYFAHNSNMIYYLFNFFS